MLRCRHASAAVVCQTSVATKRTRFRSPLVSFASPKKICGSIISFPPPKTSTYSTPINTHTITVREREREREREENSFIIGTAVINTHTHHTSRCHSKHTCTQLVTQAADVYQAEMFRV
jgi:hypothetical protein